MSFELEPLDLVPASAVAPRAVEWLWRGRLAYGEPALLDGDPGAGKSFVTVDLAARLSRGGPWPDDPAPFEPANSLILNAEDDAAGALRPRLAADLDRVFLRGGPGRPVRLPDDLGRIDELAAERAVRFVVCDPIGAFFGAALMGGESAARAALEPVAELCRRRRLAWLFTRHLSKRGGRRAVHRGLGSVGLVARVRSALLLAADPADATRRVLATTKSNLAEPPPALALRLTGEGRLEWLGAAEYTADEVAAADRPTPRRTAADWLTAALAGGARPAAELEELAAEAGHAATTLKRARAEVGVVSFQQSRRWYWAMPGKSQVPWLGDELPPLLDLNPLPPLRTRRGGRSRPEGDANDRP
jgi:AAA domain